MLALLKVIDIGLQAWHGWVIAVGLFVAMWIWALPSLIRAWKWKHSFVDIPGTPVRMVCRNYEDPTRLGKAVNLALAALIGHGPWSPNEVIEAIPVGLKFDVMDGESVQWGKGRVGGLQMGGVLLVNRSLDVVCHEMAHLFRQQIDKVTDYDDPVTGLHEAWKTNGLYKAIDAFQAELKKL